MSEKQISPLHAYIMIQCAFSYAMNEFWSKCHESLVGVRGLRVNSFVVDDGAIVK